MKDPVAPDRIQRVLAEARLFSEKVLRPDAGRFDREERLPAELVQEMARRRYTLAGLPESWGGLGLDPVAYGLFTEEIGKGCCSCRSLVTVTNSLIGETLLKWGTDSQKTRWIGAMADGGKIGAFALSEPETGSDARGVRTRYSRSGGGFIVNGCKKWVSFGEMADFYIVIAAAGDQITAFLVERDRPGVAVTPQRGLLANRAAHLAQIEFNDVRVPEESVVGKPGGGFAFIASTALDHGRYSIAWAGVSIAQAALDAMVAYARQRRQFGAPIASFQLVQGMIARAAAKTAAARSLCTTAGELRAARSPVASAQTCMAKYFSSKAANEVASDAVQIHGGNGCSNRYPAERLFREARLLEIIEGTSQIQEQIIAKYALGAFGRC
jgi:hypothetical protein